MATLELKSNLHALIDKVNNERLLSVILMFLEQNEINNTKPENGFFKNLTEDQKKEVLDAFDEAESLENLLPSSFVLKRD